MFIKNGKWDWPIWKVITGKDPLTFKFILKLLIFGIAVKIIIINGIGILFFGMEPFPILRFFG
jgi:hypothetical protein